MEEQLRHGLEFHGLGWDHRARHIKLYMFFESRWLLPADLAAIIAPASDENYRPNGIVSWTYQGKASSSGHGHGPGGDRVGRHDPADSPVGRLLEKKVSLCRDRANVSYCCAKL